MLRSTEHVNLEPTSPTMTYESDQLGELIDQKLDCLLRLRDMGVRQLELVRDGRMTDLLDLLAVKQQTIQQMQRVERELDPFRQQDPSTRTWRSAELHRQCAERITLCESLLAEILNREKQGEQELIHHRDQTAGQLQGVQRANQARDAYIDPEPKSASQLDISSDR